ncbi:hypothetical protein RFI_02589 [Reticulomyxa filosa]|uniref:PI3K/PI4K catalytic domain-containing protein n=1 Tax=Reticulomyxa filosa TaxID=46433 RepID=X6P8I5_RETFI|nr:hypothetical protein RFI_02589 [Reticulomyxa filosa]|eukprot:ETO34506.1 hypothetical protein RFI_02589 [Reticulomyxa filosa]
MCTDEKHSLMNAIWAQHNLHYRQCPVRALTYHCVAMEPSFGCIELVDNCTPLKLIQMMDKFDQSSLENLVASAAGAYVAAYAMGIRDRHFDNVLIRNDGTLERVPHLDTSDFAITQDFQSILGSQWNDFVDLAVKAFMILREHWEELFHFAELAFAFVLLDGKQAVTPLENVSGPSDSIKTLDKKIDENEHKTHLCFNNSKILYDWFHTRLEIHVQPNEVRAVEHHIYRLLMKAPDNWSTRMKNAVHSLATSPWYNNYMSWDMMRQSIQIFGFGENSAVISAEDPTQFPKPNRDKLNVYQSRSTL